jgi:hypothetical protein
MLKIVGCAIAASLIGCTTIPTGQIIEPAGPAPTRAQAEQMVLPILQRSLRDPESLRQFAILGEPRLVNGLTAGQNVEQGWLVCIEYNAKNGFGGYAGLKTDGYVLRLSGDEYIVVSQINWISADRRCG